MVEVAGIGRRERRMRSAIWTAGRSRRRERMFCRRRRTSHRMTAKPEEVCSLFDVSLFDVSVVGLLAAQAPFECSVSRSQGYGARQHERRYPAARARQGHRRLHPGRLRGLSRRPRLGRAPEHDDQGAARSEEDPCHQHIEAALFTAWKGEQLVGQVSASVDRAWLEVSNDGTGHFGYFDTIDDEEVAKALLGRAEEWLRSKGMKRVNGPMGLSANQEVGIWWRVASTRPCWTWDTRVRPQRPHSAVLRNARHRLRVLS